MEELDVKDNRLATLPGGIGALNSLFYLDLSGNQLESLPKEITGLTGLTFLDLSSNRFPDASAGMEEWLEALQERGCSVRPAR